MEHRSFSELLGASGAAGKDARVSLSSLSSFLGFSCMYAFYFVLIFGSSLFPQGTADTVDAVACRAILGFASGALIILIRAVDGRGGFRLRGVLRTVLVLVSLAAIPLYLLLDAGVTGAPVYALWAVLGIPCATGYYMWTDALGGHRRGVTIAFMAAANLLAAVIVCAVSVMAQPYALVFSLVLPVASLLFHGLWQSGGGRVENPEHSREHRGRLVVDGFLRVMTQCFGFGLGIACIISGTLPAISSGAVASSLVVAASCIVLLVDWRAVGFLNEERSDRYLFAVVLAGSLAAAFGGGVVRLVAGMVLVLVMWAFALIGCTSESESARHAGLNLKMALARDWGFSLFGTGAGLLVGFAGIAMASSAPLVFPVAVCAIVVVIAVVKAYSEAPRATPDVRGLQIDVAGSAAERSAGAVSESGDDASGDDAPAEKKRRFKERCEAIADAGGLSARQREVMMLLARGRDSKYIQEKLVISRGTADTHVYNIYRKLDIHSKQELIDLIEGQD